VPGQRILTILPAPRKTVARPSPRATRALTRTTDSRLRAGVPATSALLPAGDGAFVGFGTQGDGLEVFAEAFEDPFGKGFAEVGWGGGEAGQRLDVRGRRGAGARRGAAPCRASDAGSGASGSSPSMAPRYNRRAAMKLRTAPLSLFLLVFLSAAPAVRAARTAPRLDALHSVELPPAALSRLADEAVRPSPPATPSLALLLPSDRSLAAALTALDEPERASLLARRRFRLAGPAFPLSRLQPSVRGRETASWRNFRPGEPNLKQLHLFHLDSRQGDLFIEPDPLGPVDSPNLYQAFGFDGLNVRDPWGAQVLGANLDWEYAPGGRMSPENQQRRQEAAEAAAREAARKKWEAENAAAYRYAVEHGARSKAEIRNLATDYFAAHGYGRTTVGATKRMGEAFEPDSSESRYLADRVRGAVLKGAGKHGDALEKIAVGEGWLAVQGLGAIAGAEGEVVQASKTLTTQGTGSRSLVGIPHGFRSVAQFEDFAAKLNTGLREAGFEDAEAIFQGSSVTGKKFTTGVPFDVGRVSDFDVGLASPKLLDRARAIGVALRSGGARTAPLTAQQLEALGLRQLADELALEAGRPVNFMVFESVDAATSKAPSIIVPSGG
jgi:hypothetical protein